MKILRNLFNQENNSGSILNFNEQLSTQSMLVIKGGIDDDPPLDTDDDVWASDLEEDQSKIK